MVFNFLLAMMLGYIFYKKGADYLLQARVMDDVRAETIGYISFLISGTILGDTIGIWTIYHYSANHILYQVSVGTTFSILIGEAFFLYNRRLVRRIPTIQERKNY